MKTSTETTSVSTTDATATSVQTGENLTGRSVFLVETVAAGVAVRTLFLTEEQKLLEMPAVFPDLTYALSQIDDLRRAVMQHFSQAAQVGAQVIAAQQAANATEAIGAPDAESTAKATSTV